MFQTAQVTAVDEVNNLIQVKYSKTGAVALMRVPPIFGSSTNGIQYMPSQGDIVFVEDSDGYHMYIIGSYVDADSQKTLTPGQLLIFNQAGASVSLNSDGSISLIPAAGKTVKLGISPNHAIVRDGDTVSVSGTDSHGDTFTGTGTVHASSTQLIGG